MARHIVPFIICFAKIKVTVERMLGRQSQAKVLLGYDEIMFYDGLSHHSLGLCGKSASETER